MAAQGNIIEDYSLIKSPEAVAKELETLHAEKKGLEEQVKRQAIELQAAAEQAKGHKTELETAAEQAKKHETELKAAREMDEAYKAKEAVSFATINTLQTAKEQEQQTMYDLKTEMKVVKEEYALLKEAFNKVTHQLDDFKNQLTLQHQGFTQLIIQLKSKLDNVTLERDQLSIDLKTAREYGVTRDQTIQNLHAQLNATGNDLNSRAQTIQTLEADLKDAQEESAEKVGTIKELQDNLKKVTEENVTKTQTITMHGNTIRDLRGTITNLEGQVDALTDQNAALQEQVRIAREQASRREGELRRLAGLEETLQAKDLFCRQLQSNLTHSNQAHSRDNQMNSQRYTELQQQHAAYVVAHPTK